MLFLEHRDGHGLASIDLFFRTLATARGRYAASIILSGTGTDGTLGMKTVKEQGGLTMVQDPSQAQYAGMPESAINAGLADLVLPARDMAGELISYKENLGQIQISETDEELLQDILKKVRAQTGHDFSNYKKPSVRRRIERRMQVRRTPVLSDYLSSLEKNPGEIGALFKDLLISVTSFFRDPEAFEVLSEKVVPELFKGKEPDDQVRIWVPGCATGEEAYSIAMLVQDYRRSLNHPPEVKIFASDIDEDALASGRRGRYSESIAADVSEQHLRRYFEKQDHYYQLKPEIMEVVLFAQHNLLRDPPFSKLDLITCRNLLIYFERELQSEVFNILHYALQPGGWLFLGKSASNLEAEELFTIVDKKHRIYRRSQAAKKDRTFPKMPLQFARKHIKRPRSTGESNHQTTDGERLHHRLLARLYAPPSVVIDGNYKIIHATEGIQAYLEYSGGEPSNNIRDMIKPQLRHTLRRLLLKARQGNSPARQVVFLDTNEEESEVEIKIHYYSGAEFPKGLFHVAFIPLEDLKTSINNNTDLSEEESNMVEVLEAELEQTHYNLQATTQEYETSNEELRSSNEELQSMNEELQSTTEELETSQEELQSVNEELNEANERLEKEIEKVRRVNSDLKNLMDATEIGILFLDREFHVQRFTSAATEIFNVTSADRGRPLAHFTHQLQYDTLDEDLENVLSNPSKIKKVVSSRDGRWYVMRMRPYQSVEDKIDGVVLTFVEITELREAQQQLTQQRKQESLATLGVYALERRDLKAVYHRALQQLRLGLEIDYALLYSWDSENNMLRLKDHTGWEPGKEKTTAFSADQTWDAGYALQAKRPVVVTDYGREERFSRSPAARHLDITSGVHVAIDSLGVIGLYTRQPRRFSKDDIHFIKVVGNIIGMTSERIQAIQALREEIKLSNQYQKQILNNSIVERWNLGEYLHDELGQQLAAIKITIAGIKNDLEEDGLEVSPDFTRVMERIDENISSLRNLTRDIIPVDIEADGVGDALQLLVRDLQKNHKIGCTLRMGAVIDKIKDRKIATNLYLIIQEAYKNAAKHADAKHVEVVLEEDGDHLQLQITDDGQGLPASRSTKREEGSGINIMRHRIEMCGGTFKIEEVDRPKRSGTRITCTLPLDQLVQSEE